MFSRGRFLSAPMVLGAVLNTRPDDVFVEVICCGICHAGLYQIKNDLGMSNYPMVPGIGVVSGKAIFGPPLEEYWTKKLQEQAATKETDTGSS